MYKNSVHTKNFNHTGNNNQKLLCIKPHRKSKNIPKVETNQAYLLTVMY